MDAIVLAALTELIAEATGREASEVVPGSLLEPDLGLDSLALLEVVIRAEDGFGIVLPDEVPRLVTVSDVVAHFVEALACARPHAFARPLSPA